MIENLYADMFLSCVTGNVSQWGEVKKKTVDRTRPKPKDVQNNSTESPSASHRGGRGRGGFEGRGRARGDRGRGGRGGRAGAQVANGSHASGPGATTDAPSATEPSVAPTWGDIDKGTNFDSFNQINR